MQKIKLTRGKFALVDDKDFDWLNRWKWQALKGKKTWYAIRSVRIPGSKRLKGLLMHRVILGLKERRSHCDHIHGDGLNNRRSNLRRATHAQNMHNQKVRIGGSSRFKGVCWDKHNSKWRAKINFEKQRFELGYFKSERKAARAYNKRAKELFGEFARTNNV